MIEKKLIILIITITRHSERAYLRLRHSVSQRIRFVAYAFE